MKKNNNTSHFVRKEGFYVILFICLCVVVTIFAVTSKNKRIAEEEKVEEQSNSKQESMADIKNPEITLNNEESDFEEFYNNALQVKKNENIQNKNSEDNKNNENENIQSKNVESQPQKAAVNVSTKLNSQMIKPVEGEIAREYSEVPVFWDSLGTMRPNFGIDIKAELGESVVAVQAGTVVEVGDSKEGFGKMVKIQHDNGLISVYANLDSNIIVSKSQKVKQGQKIGEVGNTSLRSFNEKYGSNLHFELLKDNKPINPEKYIKY